MKKKFVVAIFTDLDGSLLHRDTFKFDPIKNYIKNLVNDGIIIIPNSSKTEKEIESFNEELGIQLPYISENKNKHSFAGSTGTKHIVLQVLFCLFVCFCNVYIYIIFTNRGVIYRVLSET